MSEYRKEYKRYIARQNAGKISKEDFNTWAIIAKSAIADYDDGLISYDKLIGIFNKWENIFMFRYSPIFSIFCRTF